MALRLPNFNRSIPISTSDGLPTTPFIQWWQILVEKFNSLADLVQAIQDAQDAADAAQAAAVAANTAATNAQTSADNAQAAVDAIPTGSVTITTSGSLSGDDATTLVDASGGAVNLSLPSAGSYIAPFRVQKVDATANVVTISAIGGDSVNSGASVGINTQYQSVTFSSDGLNAWYAG